MRLDPGEDLPRRIGAQKGQFLGLLGGELLQHEIGGLHAPRGPANPDPHACEVGCAKVLGNGLQSVVATETAAGLQLNRAKVTLKLVVENDDMGGWGWKRSG